MAMLLACAAVAGCAASQSAAARDPMRCERDPACARARGKYIDCDQQCQDDPECVNRCKQARPDNGIGHP
jgi:hypothetical protein